VRVFEGKISGEGKTFGILVSRFNGAIVDKLLDGAIDCLTRHNADPDRIDVFKVPGAFEIPQALSLIAHHYDGIVCLAALIRGETSHFDLLAREVTRNVQKIALDIGVPVAYGVITADSMEQAIDRAGGKQGNKGFDAALSLMEQIGLKSTVNEKPKKGKRARA
jgi:6,7-dimethyl-8-ribityllumazine synthase